MHLDANFAQSARGDDESRRQPERPHPLPFFVRTVLPPLSLQQGSLQKSRVQSSYCLGGDVLL